MKLPNSNNIKLDEDNVYAKLSIYIHYRNTLVSYQYTEVCNGFQTPVFFN